MRAVRSRAGLLATWGRGASRRRARNGTAGPAQASPAKDGDSWKAKEFFGKECRPEDLPTPALSVRWPKHIPGIQTEPNRAF